MNTPLHIQRIPCHTINLQPRQRFRTIIGLIHCPAVVVVVVVIDHTAAAAVHHCAVIASGGSPPVHIDIQPELHRQRHTVCVCQPQSVPRAD